jgi:DNA repair protein RadC
MRGDRAYILRQIEEEKTRNLVVAFLRGQEAQNRREIKWAPAAIEAAQELIPLNAEEEYLVGIILDGRNRCITSKVITKGNEEHTIVCPRQILRWVLKASGSRAIILVHNHPSGDVTPSQMDLEVTRVIRDACALMRVSFLDHIVIAGSDYCSIRESFGSELFCQSSGAPITRSGGWR